jgi:MinD superfamily P-loop ATPase
MKKVAILSGKGGVGKSSITASLAVALAQDHRIICADCDVDASNLALVFGAQDFDEKKDLSTNEKAVFDYTRCTSCKRCVDTCHFDAIGWKDDKPYLKEFSCEGCGACPLVCPSDAITLKRVNNATIGHAKTPYGFKVVSAQLNIGESGSGKVVYEVRKKAMELSEDSQIMLIDSAAGIGCPVIASVSGTDHAVIVTEPTPSGFSDMRRALEVTGHFNIRSSLIINKYDLNHEMAQTIRDFASQEGLRILAEIAFDRNFSQALTQMEPIIRIDRKYEEIFENLKQGILEELKIK